MRRRSVLLVDDERENLNLLANVLAGECFTYRARDGETALQILRDHDVQMIISDQRMPRMSGVELLERARALKPDIIRVLVTAYPDVDAAILAINRGHVRRYISKPFDPVELRALVRQELEAFDLERSNRRMGEELGRVVEELLQFNRELRQLDRMKDSFLASISHELKTPLVSSVGYVDLMLQGGLGRLEPRMERGLRVAHRNLQRLLGMIEDLMTLARMRFQPQALVLTTFDLKALAGECLDSLRARSRKTSLRLSVSFPRRLPLVRADERKVHSVITNLLSNAEKFSPDHARIGFSVRRSGRKCVVKVSNNGTGPRRARPAAGIPYFKDGEGPPSKDKGGLGIGLMLARQVLEAHGCSLDFAPDVRGGAVVTFDLPLANG